MVYLLGDYFLSRIHQVHICSCRTAHVGLAQNELRCVFTVMQQRCALIDAGQQYTRIRPWKHKRYMSGGATHCWLLFTRCVDNTRCTANLQAILLHI